MAQGPLTVRTGHRTPNSVFWKASQGSHGIIVKFGARLSRFARLQQRTHCALLLSSSYE